MTLSNTLIVGILPALLLVWTGARVRSAANGEEGTVRWERFLLGTLALSFVVPTIAMPLDRFAFPLLLLPTMCGILAALFLHLFSGRLVWSRNIRILALFLGVLSLFIGVGLASNSPVVSWVLHTMFCGALVAFVWQVWRWVGRWFLGAYAITVVLLLVSTWAADTGRPLVETPVWLAAIVKMAGYLMPGIAIIVAAQLVHEGQMGVGPVDWRKAILSCVLILPILLLVGYQMWVASVWDVATDGLRSIFLWLLISIAGIAAAMQLGWALPGKRKLAALAFAVVVPVSMMAAERRGTWGPYGEWGKMPIAVTEQRAEVANRAIQRYYERNGYYPHTLADLTPRYLVYIPNPLIIPGQTWCYEGGDSHYRLGYVYRQYFSSAASVRVHAAVGEPPVSGWGCEEEAAKYPAPPGYYGP
jgi:hypothetical protein